MITRLGTSAVIHALLPSHSWLPARLDMYAAFPPDTRGIGIRLKPPDGKRTDVGDPGSPSVRSDLGERRRVLGEAARARRDEAREPAAQQRAGARDLGLEGRDPADRRAPVGRLEVDLAAVVADRQVGGVRVGEAAAGTSSTISSWPMTLPLRNRRTAPMPSGSSAPGRSISEVSMASSAASWRRYAGVRRRCGVGGGRDVLLDALARDREAVDAAMERYITALAA